MLFIVSSTFPLYFTSPNNNIVNCYICYSFSKSSNHVTRISNCKYNNTDSCNIVTCDTSPTGAQYNFLCFLDLWFLVFWSYQVQNLEAENNNDTITASTTITTTAMDRQIFDFILADNDTFYSKVHCLGHYQPNIETELLQPFINNMDKNNALEITKEHLSLS